MMPARTTATHLRRLSAAGLTAGACLLGSTALAAGGDAKSAMKEMKPESLYQKGWSVDTLLDEAKVIGANGKEIGGVENLIVDKQGQIVAAIVEVGGFIDIGDTHVAVPWKQVTRTGDRLEVPLTEANAEDFSLFDEGLFTRADVGTLQTVDDDLRAGFDLWKASELLGDYAVLEDGTGYGYVSDLIFDDQGKLRSVVVDNTSAYGMRGYYAYPWYGYGYAGYAWHPGLGHYVLPHAGPEAADFAVFEYDRLAN